MPANPFKPTAGKMPPILIGRQSVIDDFTEGLDNGAGAPGRLMLITGQRGYGKTVMLTEFSRIARARGWETYDDTAAEGLTERLTQKLSSGQSKVGQISIDPSLSIPGVGSLHLGQAALKPSSASSLDLRDALNLQLKKARKGKGVLITIDEAQAMSMDDIVAVATAVQHVTRDQDLTDAPDSEKRGVALALAALPALVDEILNDRIVTFLRRALRHELSDIPLPDVRTAYMETIEESGKHITEEVAREAAELSQGYPYMVQLVGYYMWQFAHRRHSRQIEESDLENGSESAREVFYEAVCAPAYESLRQPQQEFLDAMASDWPQPSNVSEVAKRVGRSRSWAAKYRSSLIEENVIREAGHGNVAYTIPHFGSYMQAREKRTGER